MSKTTYVISAFPCCGKTYSYLEAARYHPNIAILDSDSSKFSWILDEYGNSTGERNPDFPQNYIEHIKSNIGKVDIIFVSSHREVREALQKAGIKFGAIIPGMDCKAEWIGRAYLRGSSVQFIDMLNHCWTEWLLDYDDPNISYPVLRLGKYDYIDAHRIIYGAAFLELKEDFNG